MKKEKKDMSIKEVLKRYPKAEIVFRKYGINCAGCNAFIAKTLKDLASIERINVELLIKDLERFIQKSQ